MFVLGFSIIYCFILFSFILFYFILFSFILFALMFIYLFSSIYFNDSSLYIYIIQTPINQPCGTCYTHTMLQIPASM